VRSFSVVKLNLLQHYQFVNLSTRGMKRCTLPFHPSCTYCPRCIVLGMKRYASILCHIIYYILYICTVTELFISLFHYNFFLLKQPSCDILFFQRALNKILLNDNELHSSVQHQEMFSTVSITHIKQRTILAASFVFVDHFLVSNTR
jgi:hypothetical protein